MKYYSDVTKKVYDTVEALESAETEANAAKAQRKIDADKVEAATKKVGDAYKAYQEACKERDEALTDFCKKYGSYKTSVKSEDVRNLDPLADLLHFSFFDF